jgi:hypothetical protein
MNQDFLDLLSALSAAEVRFLVVGAYAVGVHGRPRATKDLDVWIEATRENAVRVIQALREFGAPLGDLVAGDQAWPRRIETLFGDVRCPVISFADLLANKRAAGRPQDLADVTALERLEALRKRQPT